MRIGHLFLILPAMLSCAEPTAPRTDGVQVYVVDRANGSVLPYTMEVGIEFVADTLRLKPDGMFSERRIRRVLLHPVVATVSELIEGTYVADEIRITATLIDSSSVLIYTRAGAALTRPFLGVLLHYRPDQ